MALKASSIVVLLAAGESSRTTIMKQLYKIDGEYLINLQIRKLLSYGYNVTVVLGCEYEKIMGILDENVKIIQNINYKDGMFSSVKEAFKKLEEDALLFCHVDRPVADKNVFELLLQCESDIAVAYLHKKKAPPIMIKSTMRDSILNSSTSRLDNWILNNISTSFIEVKDEKVHFNANTDEELEKYFG